MTCPVRTRNSEEAPPRFPARRRPGLPFLFISFSLYFFLRVFLTYFIISFGSVSQNWRTRMTPSILYRLSSVSYGIWLEMSITVYS